MKPETALVATKVIDADLHNFGQRVELTERACGTWFRKPRTVYWEWLFFGKSSPLKRLFALSGPNGDISFADSIFNLEVEPVHHWLGYSKKVETHSGFPPSETHFYSFGVLLAYTYVFGIRDLHCGNLVMTPTHFQVVDAEVVLTRLILPNETILLSFKQVSWRESGIGALLPEGPDLSHDDARAFLGGYVDMFQHLIKKRELILAELQSIVDPDVPIRVLVRNTLEYNPAHAAVKKNDFLPEETAQLDRGDVPYFFKKSGDDSLRWLQAPGVAASVPSLGRFKADIDRHADKLRSLMSEPLVNDARLIQGLMLICRKLGLNQSYALSGKTNISARSINLNSIKYNLVQI